MGPELTILGHMTIIEMFQNPTETEQTDKRMKGTKQD